MLIEKPTKDELDKMREFVELDKYDKSTMFRLLHNCNSILLKYNLGGTIECLNCSFFLIQTQCRNYLNQI